MRNNTTKTERGIEFYENDIYKYADEYINLEFNGEHERINGNSSAFTGMIKYIYKNVFKPKKNDRIYYNSPNTILDTGDIDTLDSIWEVYTSLCYKYKKRPTLLNFSLLIGMDKDTFTTWESGKMRAKPAESGRTHSSTVKKWKSECEANLLDGVTENNSIGCIFALKANYGYVEQPQRIELVATNQPTISKEELIEQYGPQLLEGKKPVDF